MALINFSRSATRRIVTRVSAVFLIFIGFFAVLFASTPKMPGGSSLEGSSFLGGDIAHADAPTCGDSGDSSSCAGDCAGGGDSGDSGKLICTELFRQGRLNPAWYEADERFGKLVPDYIRDGYQFWARPVVRVMQRSRIATLVVESVAKPWAQQMAYEMGVAEIGSRTGRIAMAIGVPVCSAIGVTLKILKRSPRQIG